MRGLCGGCCKIAMPEAAEGAEIGNTWEEEKKKKRCFGREGRTDGAGNEGMTQCPLGG